MPRLLAAVLAVLFSACALAAPEYYRFDTVHSQILVSASHNGFSNPVGRMQIADGWLRFDPADWSASDLVVDIDTASIDLGDEHWNAALRAENYLAASAYPLARFSADSVERIDPDSGVVHGVLVLKGHRQPLDIAFTLNRNELTIFGMHKVAGFSAATSFDRFDFGMTANDGSVGHEVSVRLEIEAIRDPDAGADYFRRHHPESTE